MKNIAITSDQMYRIEEHGHDILGMHRAYMMENAGHGISDFIVQKFKGRLKDRNVVVVCGTGNNGGDGFVAARHLTNYHCKVTCIILGSPEVIKTEEANIMWGIINRMKTVETILCVKVDKKIKDKISRANIIIDAIFGTGIRNGIRKPHSSVIEMINKSRAYILAVDIPSGLDPTNGEIHDMCVEADTTVTFHRMKTGLLKKNKFTGKVHIENIGIPFEIEAGILTK